MAIMTEIKNKIVDLYCSNNMVSKPANTAGILVGLNLTGNLFSLLTGDNSLNAVFDIAAPVAAMTYADNSIDKPEIKNVVAPLLVGGAAYGFADELMGAENYQGALGPMLETMRNGYQNVSSVFGETGAGVPAGILGFLGTLATKGIKYLRRE